MKTTNYLFVGLFAVGSLFALGACDSEETGGNGGNGGEGGGTTTSTTSTTTTTASTGGGGGEGGGAAASKCPEYCTAVMGACTGVNQQYPNMKSCEGACAAFEAGADGAMAGNSVACRLYHSGAAKMDAGTHCVHAGPLGGGDTFCGENCDGFCTIAGKICPDVYKTVDECKAECKEFPGTDKVPYSSEVTTGDSLACRAYHLTVAVEEPGTHCAHINKSSSTCKAAP